MNRCLDRSHRYLLSSIFIGIIVSLTILIISRVKAFYLVERPIANGQVNQSYLYAEEFDGNTHKGIDYVANFGTNVYSITGGEVVDVIEHYDDGSIGDNGFGNLVMIRHTTQHFVRQNNGQFEYQMGYVYSIYAHLRKNSVIVNENDVVSAGQKIAEVDDTGNSTGDHLHLQIVLDTSPNHTQGNDYGWTETHSRNPEPWFSPYNGNTARAVGKITDAEGNPLSNVIICGMLKPYGAYAWSRTYSYAWANPDDIFVENFGTTDVSPGTRHLYAYPYTSPDSTCTGNPIKDLGWHTFMAGETTFTGLYPVYLPGIRSTTSANGIDSSIVIRNNSTTYTAQVITTIFWSGGGVKEQRTDYVTPQASITINPADSFTGSAIVMSSQDVSIVVTNNRQVIEAYAAYTGIRETSTVAHVPILHRNNSGWYNRIYIQNVGMGASYVTVNYYPATSGNNCTRSYTINQNGQQTIDLYNENCVGTPFIGSAYITSDEPIVVVWEQYKYNSAEIMISGNEGGLANTIYSPLIQNYNSNWVSGLAVQNASSFTNSLSIYFRNPDGIVCNLDVHSNVLSRYSAIRFPPPPGCGTILSANITGYSLPVAANINQLKLNTANATDYPAISSPGPKAYLPWINESSLWLPGIQIQIVGSQATTVRIKFYYSNGTYFTSVTTPLLNQYQSYTYLGVPNTSNFQGTAIVESLSAPQTSIAVAVNHLKSGGSGSDLIMTFIGDPR